jgi:transposase
MRKRKRDWPMRVIKIRAYPRVIPDSVWAIAKDQRKLWNDLTSMWKATADLAANLPEQKKEMWKQFEDWAAAAVKLSGLDWVNGPDILDRLRATTRSRKQAPRFHGALQRVSIGHRYTGGGKALEEVIDPGVQVRRFALVSSKDWIASQRSQIGQHSPKRKHWRGRFQVGEETIEYSLALHRELPERAILKRVAWLGERSGPTWFWYLALTVEEEPVQGSCVTTSSETTSSAAIDLGWRLFADGTKQDRLRVGMLADSEARMIELRLPLRLRPNRVQEQRGLDTIAQWQAEASKLDKSSDEYRMLTREMRQLRFRLIQRRRWYYLNLANWLCQRYKRIALEDMSIKDLHRKPDDPALQNSAQYRNYAAIGEFRALLLRTATKYGCEVIPVDSIDSTRTCWECGAKAEASGHLTLKCENGHEWDQDKNAARNLFSQLEGTFGQTHSLRKITTTGKWKRLELPESIGAVAVEVPA